MFLVRVSLQIYFYAGYLFQESGIPADRIPYVTIGTGACECITALTCVRIGAAGGRPASGAHGAHGLCFLQGILIESLGRRILIMGGYALMSICCILFTLALTFQVILSSGCFI